MSDQRNHHAHILTTTRTYADGILGEKTRILDSPKTSGKEVEYMRQAWANFVNRALEWAGHDTRIREQTSGRTRKAENCNPRSRGYPCQDTRKNVGPESARR